MLLNKYTSVSNIINIMAKIALVCVCLNVYLSPHSLTEEYFSVISRNCTRDRMYVENLSDKMFS